jgi:hypothetical protein
MVFEKNSPHLNSPLSLVALVLLLLEPVAI